MFTLICSVNYSVFRIQIRCQGRVSLKNFPKGLGINDKVRQNIPVFRSNSGHETFMQSLCDLEPWTGLDIMHRLICEL